MARDLAIWSPKRNVVDRTGTSLTRMPFMLAKSSMTWAAPCRAMRA
jgi:hypothetical protein